MYFIAMFVDSDGPLLIALAVAALMVILASSSGKKRPSQHQRISPEKAHTCRGCGTMHAGYANFCRRCGQRLG